MHTELQSAILAALRTRHPEAMSDDDIRTATGDYASIIHALACTLACMGLLQQGQIELVEGGKKWKLADTGMPVSESHLGEIVGQPEAGVDRKTLPPSEEYCHARRDGEDCYWKACPQVRDGEPGATGTPDGVEGDDRAAGQILLSPEFHAIHIADEGANSTRAWWGELEREAQEAIAGELVGAAER